MLESVLIFKDKDMNIRIYKGNSENYGITEEEVTYDIMSFSGGERHVQFHDVNQLQCLDRWADKDDDYIPRTPDNDYIYVIANLLDPSDIMDLLLICDVINQYDNKLILEIPYFPYARQDRVCADGQAFSARVFKRLVSMCRPGIFYTWDIHSEATLVGLKRMLPNTRIINVLPYQFVTKSERLTEYFKSEDSILVVPDKGAISRCKQLQAYINKDLSMVMCSKVRDPKTGHILKTVVGEEDEIHHNTISFEGKTAIIPDDICDGGYTFIKIAEKLRELGVSKVILYVTHGIFSKGRGVFSGLIDEVFYTNSRDSMPFPENNSGTVYRTIEFERKLEVKNEKSKR